MSSPAPFRKILLIGATGSIGQHILQALLTDPSLTITVLTRASSTTTLPSNNNIRTVAVPDTYPTASLIPAFTGQDVVISCLTTLSTPHQLRLIDAAVAAGVRRYVPSEYGLNNARADAQALCAVFAAKGAVQRYLREREDRIEWMSVSCGMWLRWSMAHDFLGMRVRERRFALWDGGRGRFSVTTEGETAKAVLRGLTERAEETRNRNVLVEEFVTTQAELLAEIERQTGEKFEVEEVDGEERIRELQKAYEAGDEGAVYGLIEAGFITGRYGGDLSKEGEIFTEKLGLKRHTLEEVVADALAYLK